jgi:hypothetical protein
MSIDLSPSERLAISREALRIALKGGSTSVRGQSSSAGATVPEWLVGLKSVPGADVIIDAALAWWAQHPFRTACLVAAEAAKTVVQPIAQRHPLGLVIGAVFVGALVVKTRPWRWLLTPALFAGLLPQLLSRAVAKMPPRSWMAVLTAMLQAQQKPSKPETP